MAQKHLTLAYVMLLLTISMLAWSTVDALMQSAGVGAVEPQLTATAGPSPTPAHCERYPHVECSYPEPVPTVYPDDVPIYCFEYPTPECPFPTPAPYPTPGPYRTAIPYPHDCEIEPELCGHATPVSAPDTAVPEATVIPIPTLTPRISSHSPDPPAPALLTIAQRSEPNLVAGRGTLVAFTLDIVNRGLGTTTKAVVTMPIDPAEVAVVDVQLSRPDAWVSMLLHDRIELSVDKPLAPGERVAVTVRLRVLPRVVLGAILGESLTVRWSDDAGGGARRGNIAPLVAGATNQSAPVYPLHGETAAGTSQTFRARIFAPDEPVSLWWATPTGANIAKGELWAGVDGTITTTVNTAGLAPGAYTVVAYGQWTAFTAVGSFVVR